ncbi:MAG: alpha-2-macroglobulin family protein [Kofleriaceae bacterium]
MRLLSLCSLFALATCATSDGAPKPSAPAVPDASVPKVFAQLERAPDGSVLRVFVEPNRLIGWIGGSTSFAGMRAMVRVNDNVNEHFVSVGEDNTFEYAYRATRAGEVTVRVGALVQRLTVAPPADTKPVAYVLADRSAYRPGQKLAFTAFLRKLDDTSEYRPVANTPVEVQIISDTKHTVATKLAIVADAGGRVSGEYTFSWGDPLDTYRIAITGYTGDARVTLAEHRKSKVKLEVDTAVTGRTAALTFRALDFLDKPIPGGAVTYTAQVVREPDLEPDVTGFAFGAASPRLARDTRLAVSANPETAGMPWLAARQVVDQVKGKVELDASGAGRRTIPIKSEQLRGHHRLVVDATIVDAVGREQRTTRTLPLGRSDVRVQLTTPNSLVAAGSPLEVGVGIVDAQGRSLAVTNASVAAIRIAASPVFAYYGGYNSYSPNGGFYLDYDNGIDNNWSPNGGVRGRRWRTPTTTPATETLAATTAVTGGHARFSLDDPGAYRLIASVQLPDGSSIWSELGIAVRERDDLPALILELDRHDVGQGDRITGRLQSKYRDAQALVVVRDARGIRSRQRVTLAGGLASLDLPATGLGYGAVVEAFALGTDHEIQAVQEPLHVAQTQRELAIKTTAKPTYGPGDIVDLGIELDRPEAADLVISVFDQSLLGVAPDRSVDPRSFFYGDDRLRTRAALQTVRAELGDLTVEGVLARARAATASPGLRPPTGEAGRVPPTTSPGRDTADAQLVLSQFQGDAINVYALVSLLRYAGVQATLATGYSSWTVRIDRYRLRGMRVIDLLEQETAGLVYERVADTLVVGDPASIGVLALTGVTLDGAASGNASHSAGGNMAYSAPAPAAPSLIDAAAGGSEVVRRDFSDSAFWSATTRAGADGKARVQFKLPDSLTNWQVVVTAVTRDMRVGRQITKLRTVRDVMIWPMLPRQFTEGDVVSISGSVHNLGAADRDIVVTLAAERADLLSPATVTVRVPHGGNVPVTWSVRARQAGLASLLMSAKGGGVSDASLKRIPIVAPAADQIVTASGFADRPMVIDLPAGADPATAKLEVTFAPSLAADLVQTLDYLVEYPYGCAEQTMSRFAPAIRVAGVLDHLGIKNTELTRRMPSVVAGGMKRLVELQHPDGGWGWQGSSASHEMITPYVVWGLIEAERAGYVVPDATTISRGLARIGTLIPQLDSDSTLSDRMYLIYVYSQRKAISAEWWTWVVQRSEKLSDYALALALELAVARKDTAQADAMARTLRGRAKVASGGTFWRTGGFSHWSDDPFETTAAVLKAFVAYDANDPLVAETIAYFVATKRGDRWNSTKDTAMILYAMTDYLGRKGAKVGGGAFVDYAVDAGAPVHLGFTDGLARQVGLPGNARTKLAFAKASPGMIVRAVLKYRKQGRDLAPAANGLEVRRAVFLVGARGARIRELRAGDRVPRGSYLESVVTTVQSANQPMRFLLVEDPKPAGAEALPLDDPRFPAITGNWVLREDRESHLAFHHEQVGASVEVRTYLHLELAGDLVIAPAQAELMYETTTRGHSGTFTLKVD